MVAECCSSNAFAPLEAVMVTQYFISSLSMYTKIPCKKIYVKNDLTNTIEDKAPGAYNRAGLVTGNIRGQSAKIVSN